MSRSPQNRPGSGASPGQPFKRGNRAGLATRFKPGRSGNPGGRPKALAEVQALAAEHTPEAIERLAQLMRTGPEAVAVRAAEALLDRAWGHPSQPVEHSGSGGTRALVEGLSDEELADQLERHAKLRRAAALAQHVPDAES